MSTSGQIARLHEALVKVLAPHGRSERRRWSCASPWGSETPVRSLGTPLRLDLVLPASAYAECLVSPHRRGPDAVAVVDRFVDALPARVELADRSIAAAASALRATHGTALRLPDALVIATALVLGADRILTTDAGWPAVAVPVEVLATA